MNIEDDNIIKQDNIKIEQKFLDKTNKSKEINFY